MDVEGCLAVTMSNYLSDKVNDHVLKGVTYTAPSTVYVALWTTMPDADGAGGVEVVGGGYGREVATFATSVDGVAANSAPVEFSNLPACTVAGATVHDHVSAGNMLHYYVYGAPVVVEAGKDAALPVGDIVVVTR